MALQMIRPTKHQRSGVYRLRLAIPVHLREVSGRLYGKRAEFIESLGTKAPGEAKRLAPAAEKRLRGLLAVVIADHAGLPATLTDRQCVALAGEWYHAHVEALADSPGSAASWNMARSDLWDQTDPENPNPDGGLSVELSQADRQTARQLLVKHGHPPSPKAVERVGQAVFSARMHLAELMESRAMGDYSPDPNAARFPTVAESAPGPSLSMDGLLAGWAADRGWKIGAKPIPRALYDRQMTLARLGRFLGHTDAAVTQADAVRWKEDAQRRGRHASTIRNDLSEMSAIWAWAMRNGKLALDRNPFAGISPPKAKRKARDPRAFTDDEAAQVLRAARGETGFRRWLPWLACLTGARVSELCQSDRADVFALEGVPVIRIHDEGEGRTIKNADSRRTIPLHPALVAEGFLAYVDSLPAASPLFPDIRPDAIFGIRGVTASKHMGRWLRGIGLADPLISPDHSWRHWWIDAARQTLMHPEVRSALTGHSARMDESAGYGAGMGSFIRLLADAIAKVRPPIPPEPAASPLVPATRHTRGVRRSRRSLRPSASPVA